LRGQSGAISQFVRCDAKLGEALSSLSLRHRTVNARARQSDRRVELVRRDDNDKSLLLARIVFYFQRQALLAVAGRAR
jgi:hypothetical protein